jgi:isoleucyl-tRNA synthetase
LEAFVKERSEWCISRQRTWGVPIPALHLADSGEPILTDDSLSHILGVLAEKGTSHWWDGPIEEFMSPAIAATHSPRSLIKGTDTMDVWFDSGTSWSLMDNAVADIYLEGSDQHRGWFQSSLLTAVATANSNKPVMAPFRKLITHGFVLDDKGRKMSKSLGNVISPLTVINGGSVSRAAQHYVELPTVPTESQIRSGIWHRNPEVVGCIISLLRRCNHEYNRPQAGRRAAS